MWPAPNFAAANTQGACKACLPGMMEMLEVLGLWPMGEYCSRLRTHGYGVESQGLGSCLSDGEGFPWVI